MEQYLLFSLRQNLACYFKVTFSRQNLDIRKLEFCTGRSVGGPEGGRGGFVLFCLDGVASVGLG
jgi:hypothetical protein